MLWPDLDWLCLDYDYPRFKSRRAAVNIIHSRPMRKEFILFFENSSYVIIEGLKTNMTFKLGRCQFTMIEHKRNISKNIKHKTQPNNIFLEKKESLIKHKTSSHESSVLTSLPGDCSSKSASFVITRTLPVSVSFNLMDPLEIQKPWINLFNRSFLHFA